MLQYTRNQLLACFSPFDTDKANDIPNGSLGILEAQLLIDGFSKIIIERIEKWNPKTHNQIAYMIIKSKAYSNLPCDLFDNINRFNDVNQKKLALKGIRNEQSWLICESGDTGFSVTVRKHDWIDHTIAVALIKARWGFVVAQNPFSFNTLNHKDIVWLFARREEFTELKEFIRNIRIKKK
jgi:hypothetical protein